jgi:hypothetical protein
MELVVRKFSSFEEADKADREDYLRMTPQQRLSLLLELVSQGSDDETEQGFQRVYRITKLKRS